MGNNEKNQVKRKKKRHGRNTERESGEREREIGRENGIDKDRRSSQSVLNEREWYYHVRACAL